MVQLVSFEARTKMSGDKIKWKPQIMRFNGFGSDDSILEMANVIIFFFILYELILWKFYQFETVNFQDTIMSPIESCHISLSFVL